ncbi:unknown [Prevotella sp. CAG:520]|nr:unknown [Prevotella sp. CAG:520]
MAQIGIFFQQLGKNVNKLMELMLFNYSKPTVFVNCLPQFGIRNSL